MTPEINRRKLLGAGGAALAAGLAGCSGVFADGRGVPGTEGGPSGDGGSSGPPEGIPEEVHTYLTDNEASGYEGEMVDQTGESSITIMVGAGTGFAFDPVLVNVDPGTEVTWEWTGEGGAHNVESTEAPEDFSSGDPVVEEGTTYSYTFETEGNHMYHCSPHTGSGMHGAVIVGDPSGGSDDGGDGDGNETSGDGNETSNETSGEE